MRTCLLLALGLLTPAPVLAQEWEAELPGAALERPMRIGAPLVLKVDGEPTGQAHVYFPTRLVHHLRGDRPRQKASHRQVGLAPGTVAAGAALACSLALVGVQLARGRRPARGAGLLVMGALVVGFSGCFDFAPSEQITPPRAQALRPAAGGKLEGEAWLEMSDAVQEIHLVVDPATLRHLLEQNTAQEPAPSSQAGG